MDEILDFVSQDTKLPIRDKVKRNLITRESVEKYVDKRMRDDKDTQRLEQSRLVLQKFGLLPVRLRSAHRIPSPAGRTGRRLLRCQDQERKPAGLGATGHPKAGDWRMN